MRKLATLLSGSAVALAFAASAHAWHADGVNVAATCNTQTGVYVVSATIIQNARYPATLHSITPSTFAGSTTGTKPVVVVVRFTNGEKQTWNRTVNLDGRCTIVPVSVSQALRLRNTVTNDNGGTALATAWTLSATGTVLSPTNLSGRTPVDAGASFKADTYTLAQTGGPSGYTAGGWSCVLTGTASAVAVTGDKVVVDSGKDVTCTIDNNDIAPAANPPTTPSTPTTPTTPSTPTTPTTPSTPTTPTTPSTPTTAATPSTPAPITDVAIQKSATAQVRLGADGKAAIVYELQVQNNGPGSAADVTVLDAAPGGVTFWTVAQQPLQGSCAIQDGGTVLKCAIGTLGVGTSVTIKVGATVTATGTVTNTAFATTATTESNGDNNHDSARTLVLASATPPTPRASALSLPACSTVRVAPKMLAANGIAQKLRLRVTRAGKGVVGAIVKIKGPGVSRTVKSGRGGLAVVTVKTTKAGIIKVEIRGTKGCGPQRIGVVGSFEPPVTG